MCQLRDPGRTPRRIGTFVLPEWRADMARYKAARRAARKSGDLMPEDPGPPPTGFTLLPWLLSGERVRLTVADNGTGVTTPTGAARTGIGGTGLKGLTERLAAAGGSLSAGPTPWGGFLVTAELPDLTAGTPLSLSPPYASPPTSSQVEPHIRPTLTP